MKKQSRSILSLFLWYLPVAIVQYFSSKASMDSFSPWYSELEKASWTPPSWVFGPAWTLLYIGMAVAVWIVFEKKSQKNKWPCYIAFIGQLLVNGLWSPLFFRYHLIGWALIDLTLLFVLVLITTILFFRIAKFPGWIFLLYLLWTTYALSLNWAIYQLN